LAQDYLSEKPLDWLFVIAALRSFSLMITNLLYSFGKRVMINLVIDYYERKFGEDINSTFIHLVREIGEIALSIEKGNSEHSKLKITEAAALLEYLASKYKIELHANMQHLYSKKIDRLNALGDR